VSFLICFLTLNDKMWHLVFHLCWLVFFKKKKRKEKGKDIAV